jgi:hypothetical protein
MQNIKENHQGNLDQMIQTTKEMVHRNRLADGTFWATLEDLDSHPARSTMSDDQLTDISKQIVFFKKLWIAKHGNSPRQGEETGINFFQTDLWGNDGLNPYSVRRLLPNHLIPLSETCNTHWQPLLSFMTGEFRVPASEKQRTGQACFTVPQLTLMDSAANRIMMRDRWWIDAHLDFLLIPLMTFHDMLHWDGHAYDFVFIPTCSNVFMDVQACTDEALKRKHTLTSLDPKVQQGFESMSLTLIAFINIMKHHELTADEAASARNHFPQVLRFIKTAGAFPTPKLPAKEVSLRFGSFAPGVCPLPGTSVSSTLIQGHPAPHPLLLHARNANAWLSFLWRKRGQGDARFRGPLGLDAMADSDGPPRAAGGGGLKALSRTRWPPVGGCVLFPSCADVPGFSTCPLCLARYLCCNGLEWHPEVTEGHVELAERVAAASRDEGDLAALEALRLSLLASLPMFPYELDKEEEEEKAAVERGGEGDSTPPHSPRDWETLLGFHVCQGGDGEGAH